MTPNHTSAYTSAAPITKPTRNDCNLALRNSLSMGKHRFPPAIFPPLSDGSTNVRLAPERVQPIPPNDLLESVIEEIADAGEA